MNIIHILGITIIIKTTQAIDNNQQKTLLRKLQNNQPENAATWNEVLADVLVNKIQVFSKMHEYTGNFNTTHPPEKSELANIISQVFFVYKKLVYDVFIKPNNNVQTKQIQLEIEERNDSEETRAITFSDGPKGEVELVEPRYHGKLTNGTSEEVKVTCPEGTVRVERKCVSISRLIMAIPGQCPNGYRRDGLGNCRMMF